MNNMSEKNFEISKSKEKRLELSVRIGCGRMCSYCPQDSYIKSYKKLIGKNNFLEIGLVESIIQNIPSDTIISWTGFTEPFDCPDFDKITLFFNERGMSQLISTTLYGLEKNKDFFI